MKATTRRALLYGTLVVLLIIVLLAFLEEHIGNGPF